MLTVIEKPRQEAFKGLSVIYSSLVSTQEKDTGESAIITSEKLVIQYLHYPRRPRNPFSN